MKKIITITLICGMCNLAFSQNFGIDIVPQYKLHVNGDAGLGQTFLLNSDIYFTNTAHNHSTIGNTNGYAAIENAANYNTLMILGRSNGIGGNRSVSVWDRLDVNGSLYLNSARIAPRMTQILNDFSGFPGGSYGFSTNGGSSIMVSVSGSGYNGGGGQIGIDVYVDGVFYGRARSYTNEASSHKAFCNAFIVINGLGAGGHTITFGNFNGTSYDSNDFFNVAVVEI